MATRRFFILDDTRPSRDLKTLMCLVVGNKTRPLDTYAPSKHLPPNTPAHSPRDIIKDILPSPTIRKITKDSVTAGRKRGFGAAVGKFFGFQSDSDATEAVTMTTKEVKEYLLENPEDYFYDLLDNELYNAAVKKFLLASEKKLGYLVTGILTTSDATLERTTVSNSNKETKLQLPVKEALEGAGALPPGVIPSDTVNPSLNQHSSGSLNREREAIVGKNEIIAVAYSLVKISSGKVVLKGGINARRHEAAFGDDGTPEVDISELDLDELDLEMEADDWDEDERYESNGFITWE